MKKILLIAFGLLIFGCKKSDKTIEDQSVEIGSGTEISPNVVGIQDSAIRLKVDTINSPEEAHAKEEQDSK